MADESSGRWRDGENVLVGDVFVPVQASLVWLALLVMAMVMLLPALRNAGLVQAGPGFSSKLFNQPWVTHALTISADLVLLFYLWRIARRVSDEALAARFRPVRRALLVLALLGGAVFAIGTIIASAWLVVHKVIEVHPAPGDKLIEPGPLWQLAVTFLAVSIVAPLVEEFYFRGIFLSWLGRKAGYWVAVPVSALVFALLHLRFASHPGPEGWMFTGIIACVGLSNGLLAVFTRSLWPPILFHAGYNTTLFALSVVSLLMR